MSTTSSPARQATTRPFLLLAAVFLVALNLRAGIASVPPLVGQISDDLGFGATAAGLLTTLPVVCMGVFAPLAHQVAHRFGREVAIAGALVVLAVGLLLRLGGSALVFLYGGTVLAGVGIAVCGTVLPGVIKEYFADRSGAATGVYTAGMSLGATVAAATAVPLADALDSWQEALASWSFLAVVALLAWGPVTARLNQKESDRECDDESHPTRLPWRNRTAWLVATYLSFQSTLFYAQLAWIAPAYEFEGWTAQDAGLLLGAFNLAQLAATLAVPALADRFPDRRPLFFLVVGMSLAGMLALTFAPEMLPWLAIAVLGFGQGGGFALGLLLLVDYAPDPQASGQLAAMAFLVSYSVAASGPLVLGLLHDVTGGFAVPFGILLVIDVVQLFVVARLRPGRTVSA